MSSPTRRTSALTVAGALVLCGVTGPSGAAGVLPAAKRKHVITFGKTTCAPHWRAPNPGRVHFDIENGAHTTATVYLVNAVSSNVVATLANLRGGHHGELTATMVAGRSYLWGCHLHGRTVHTSEPETVPTDPVHGGPGKYVPPLHVNEVKPALARYRTLTTKLITRVAEQVSKLRSAIGSGDLASARAAWLTAHLAWLRIGQDDGAYGAFGDLGGRIDGTAAGLAHGTSDPRFTGFHRIEFDLWTTSALADAAHDVKVLGSAVAVLGRQPLHSALPGTKPGVVNWILRAHEITEDAVRDSLSADDDYGSGTDAASITADVEATRTVLALLAPLITPRSPHLVTRARGELTRVVASAKKTRHDGRWIALTAVPRGARERLDSAVDQVDETLAPVPDLLRIGNT